MERFTPLYPDTRPTARRLLAIIDSTSLQHQDARERFNRDLPPRSFSHFTAFNQPRPMTPFLLHPLTKPSPPPSPLCVCSLAPSCSPRHPQDLLEGYMQAWSPCDLCHLGLAWIGDSKGTGRCACVYVCVSVKG